MVQETKATKHHKMHNVPLLKVLVAKVSKPPKYPYIEMLDGDPMKQRIGYANVHNQWYIRNKMNHLAESCPRHKGLSMNEGKEKREAKRHIVNKDLTLPAPLKLSNGFEAFEEGINVEWDNLEKFFCTNTRYTDWRN